MKCWNCQSEMIEAPELGQNWYKCQCGVTEYQQPDKKSKSSRQIVIEKSVIPLDKLPNPYYHDDWVTIYNNDCQEVLPLIPNKSIDLVLTDPPFGLSHEGAEWDKNIDVVELYTWLYKESLALLNNGCHSFVWLPKKELMKVGSYIPDCRYFMEIHPFAMYRTNYRWMEALTPLIVWVNGVARTNISGGRNWLLTNSANTSNNDDNPRNSKHPAAKGTETPSYIIANFSANGDIILDPFLGSGTTCYCAKKLNRKCIGIEIEEKYCEIAAKRCSQAVMELNVE